MYQEGRYHNSKPAAKQPPAEVPFPLDVIKLEPSAIKEAVLKPEDLEPLDLKQTHIPEVPPPIPELSHEEAGIQMDPPPIPESLRAIELSDTDIDEIPDISPSDYKHLKEDTAPEIELSQAELTNQYMQALVQLDRLQRASDNSPANNIELNTPLDVRTQLLADFDTLTKAIEKQKAKIFDLKEKIKTAPSANLDSNILSRSNEIAAARQKAIEKAQAAADDNQDWFEHEVTDNKQAAG